MAKFDTHGGHFAPQGYLKVNEGGSHEENPNGGVQIGVDPQGVPNMLEEGEPVYNDYVYSDNIIADEELLVKYDIPKKFAGKLYSEIADKFVDEAEERPLDPISTNGLNAMLGRLAEAQEEQKLIQQQKELEEELSQLSPEELSELEAMLSEQEQLSAEEMPQEQVSQEVVPAESVPVMEQMPTEQALGQPLMPMSLGGFLKKYSDGGIMNTYATGGWGDFINRLNAYSVSRTPGGISGTYTIDRRFPLAGYDDIKALEDSEAYRNFTEYVLRHPDDPNVQEYLRALDAGTAPNVEKLFDGDNLRENWRDLYNSRRYDQKGGIYHFSGNTPEELDALRALSRVGMPTLTAPDNLLATNPALIDPEGKRLGVPVPKETLPMRQINYGTEEPQGLAEPAQSAPLLSTLPQYAGAVGNAGLALWNAAQPADKYNIETPYPYLPYGRINLVDPTYNPMDQNAGINNVLSNSAATNTALAQSGAGYAAIPAVLANGYNTGRALGDTLASIWDANNQRHNAVLAGVNNNRSQMAQFNYANDRDRAGMLNQRGFIKSRNDLMQQQLNYNAEAQKYAAIGQMLGNTFEALSNLGERNKILNQINTNRKNEGYITGNNGAVLYAPALYSKCGGFIKKYKK